MGRSSLAARLIAGVSGAALLAGAALVAGAPAASAAIQEGLGYATSPAQPYQGNPDPSDWLGSYVVNGKQVWCVQYAFLAPNTDEQYRPGEPLKTKWGTDLPADVAADISYLLLRYTSTKSADEAAALAHLLHSWTAAPQNPGQLTPDNTFRTIAYDAAFHLPKLPPGAQQAVDRLKADATANHGPWTTKITKPAQAQVIGTPATWTVEVRNAAGKGVAAVPVTIKLTDATVGGKSEVTLPTTAEGAGIDLAVVPTGANPSLSISLLSPADRPVVQQAVQLNTQRVVSTGGEKQLTAVEKTTAVTAPGAVKVAKLDAKTGQGIAGVQLRVTGADKQAPAVGQDGKPLVGEDGKPLVVTTGADGTADVPNLKTPQDVCVTEVAAAPGYEQSFSPEAPPVTCGKLEPGKTLAVQLTNTPNTPTVPREIPAGDAPVRTAAASVSGPSTGLLVSLGALLLLAAGAGGFLVRTARGKRVVSRSMRRDWGH
ncbi:SpaA isopeptide-forming pilin-related protein [Actinokineospora bangkokensis]|uniref:SpaA-like prealbumin fold domain-containing protein n=1 Tax=Actinokineospora bangkokensis TaxID=1193682 RepID=A0A1Q9LDD9_9PSEU|nr:hypothetical protein [Actinokineospora bangkokensis]OLR90026.1 hypothetical protein BJP25_03340 [Actinokineospora bangkokensis]